MDHKCITTYITYDYKQNKSAKGIVFVDRDGTLIRDFRRFTHVVPILFINKTLKELNRFIACFLVDDLEIVVVTNQSKIGRGRLTHLQDRRFHDKLQKKLKERGIAVSKIIVCPHEESQQCACRKPNPLMLLETQKNYAKLKWSIMLGNKISDMQAGIHAGCICFRVGANLWFRSLFRGNPEGVVSYRRMTGFMRERQNYY